jgi:DnaA family protein
MRQIPLDIRLSDSAVFEAFYPGANALALKSLRDLASRPAWALIWLWGTRSTGRSHLLQAVVAAASSGGERSAYLPLALIRRFGAGVLEGLDDVRLVAIDDVDLIAGDAGWEHALFGLFEALHASGARLVMAASAPPAQAGFGLADLRSRFSGGAVFRLHQLTDEDSIRALQLRARQRGVDFPEESARYLLTRVERSLPALFELLDRLDRAALAAQRPLTVPFLRKFLESGSAPGDYPAGT